MAIPRIRVLFAITVTVIVAACSEHGTQLATPATPPIVVYSAVPDERIRPALDSYSTETGNRVHLVTGEFQSLVEKVHHPGTEAIADLFLAGNVADLWFAAEADVFRPSGSAVIAERLPEDVRDPDQLWTALSTRARVVVFNRNKVDEDEVATIVNYSSLTEERWRNRLCVSSSGIPGNGALIAMLIDAHGVRDAELIVRGWRANFALPPRKDDATLLEAIADGSCDVGIADSNVVVAFQRKSTAMDVRSFDSRGVTNIDITGAGVTRHATNPDGARMLLEWLLSENANSEFAALQSEFPANPNAVIDGSYADWTLAVSSPVDLWTLGYLQEDAEKLARRARYP